jgi:hypothetical protein
VLRHALDKRFSPGPPKQAGEGAGDNDLQILPAGPRQVSEVCKRFHHLGGIEIDDQGPAGFQAGSIQGDGAIDVLRRPRHENPAGSGPEKLHE